jgi:methionyl-tRNA synthetase
MENVSFDDFKKLDLRVAEIIEVKDHPNADKLVVLKVKVGEEEKQIVAGIKAFYRCEDLVGKKIIVVNNLEPIILRGEASQGMLLAARSNDDLGVLTIDKNIPTGATVS